MAKDNIRNTQASGNINSQWYNIAGMRTAKRIKKNQKKKILPPLDDPDLMLWVLLDQTRDVVSKARDLELDQYKLSRVHTTVLFPLLSEDKGLTIAEISNRSLRELNSVLSLVNRIEKVGLVKKVRSVDSDKVKIVLTEKGRKLYTNATRLSIEMIFSVLSEEDKQQLSASLQKLKSKGRELLGVDYKPPFLP